MPKPKEAIAAELAAAGCKSIRDSHVAELSRLLLDDERILNSLISGSPAWPNNVHHLIVTTQRVVSIGETLLTNWLGTSYTGESRTSASYVLWNDIAAIGTSGCVTCNDDNVVIEPRTRNVDQRWDCQQKRPTTPFQGIPLIAAGEARRFGEKIRARLDEVQQVRQCSSAAEITLLERLAKLRESGALDEDEFRAAKRKLLLD